VSSAAAQRAETLLSLGRPAEALAIISPALAVEPDSADLQRLLASVYLATDEAQLAFNAAVRSVSVEPDNEWGHRLVSESLSQLGDHQQAAKAAAESQRLAPWDWRTHSQRAIVCARAGFNTESVGAARHAVALAPNEPDAHFALGFAASRAGDPEFAALAYRRVLEIQPDHAMTLNNLATLQLKKRGGLRNATRGYGAALAVDAQLDVARRNLNIIARRYVRRFHYAVVVAYAVLYFSFTKAGTAGGERVSASSRWHAATFGGLALLIIVVAVMVIDRRLPANLRPYFRRLPRQDSMLGLRIGVDVAALLLICALAVPSTYAGRASLGRLAWLLLIVGVILSYAHRSSIRSSR
jgi:Flp pilus assembly protein TadD